MGVAIGLGCAEFPFSGAAAYWRWIDMCEAGGVEFDLADRPHRRTPAVP